jgi:hypothetical protein
MATYDATKPGEYIYFVTFSTHLHDDHDVLVHIAIDGFSKFCFTPYVELDLTFLGTTKHIKEILQEILDLIPDPAPLFIFGYGNDFLPAFKEYMSFVYDPLEANRFAAPTIEIVKKSIRNLS